MGSTFVEERQLLNAFMANLGSTHPAGAAEVMSGLAHGISKAITLWAGKAMVTRLMGSGPTSSPMGGASPVLGSAFMAPDGFV